MSQVSESFKINASLLQAKASKQSILGTFIAVIAVVVATVLSGFTLTGTVSLEAFVYAQKTNLVLWVLDVMPFAFAFWGQYVSSMISYEASAMVVDQTQELRTHTAILEKKAAYESTHDPLTALPNRVLFMDRLQQATNQAARESTQFAVFLFDIDRFKEVNDTLGHYNGDRLIKQVALRLKNVISEVDTLARIGGDDFGFILHHLNSPADAQDIAQKIKQTLATPFVLDNLTLDVQASIGAVFFPDHGRDTDTLIQRADVAMYVAKQDRAGFVTYSETLDIHTPHRLTLAGELREAIYKNELVLHFQPKIVGATNLATATEALVRWQHKKHGLMSPDDFIPLAERTGLIHDLTKWVLKHALQQCAQWRKANLDIDVCINISAHCLLDPDFPDVLTGLLAATDFPANKIVMEITETSIMVNPERSMEVLNRIHDMGVNFSIDDFGSGYSSLAYLKRLPVTEIKIDKLFVLDMITNESDRTIVNATIQLGHNLGLQVVAEGIEDQATFEMLKQMGCDLVQGYHICKPIPADAFYDWATQ